MSTSVKPDVCTSNDRAPKRTIFGIKTLSGFKHMKKDGRVQVGRKYENPIPEGSAQEANEQGPWQSQWDYPGIPRNKYTWEQADGLQRKHKWVMQNVYKTNEGPSEYLATYEGWNSTAAYSQIHPNFERDNRIYIKNAEVRDEFLQAIKNQKSSTPEMKRAADRHLKMKKVLLNSPDHMFWLYEDLTYFHTKIHVDYGLPPVAYICLRDDMIEPPKFKYSTFNIVAGPAFQAITEGRATKTMREVQKITKRTKEVNPPESPCEAGDSCICDRVFHLIYAKGLQEKYGTRVNMIPNKRGFLEYQKVFNPLHMRIVVECSDSCGCSSKCPRRRLQQGQTKRLVVFYENEVLNFGLRTAEKIKAGEFICEYTGMVLIPGDNDNRDSSYDAGLKLMKCGPKNNQFPVIDSSKIGNLARFMSHACNPNAVLIETHSRVYESDTLIPRISVYALKDIDVAEAITICYYQEDQLTTGEGIPCGCRPDCPNHLPMA